MHPWWQAPKPMQHPKHILGQLNIRPRKKWGQNFLVHPNNVQQIFNFANVPPQANILEIGPGLGAMTEYMIPKAKAYTAIELDPILFDFLNKTFAAPHATFLHQDVLEVSPKDLFPGQNHYHVVANLPYHITTPIIALLLKDLDRIQSITLLLQKEVVARMEAKPGSKTYGRLSVWLQSVCDVTKGPTLKPGCFYPPPDIDSQVVRLSPNGHPIKPAFLDFVALLFQKRRKTLGKILKDASYDVSLIDPALHSIRPETLDVASLQTIFNQLTPPAPSS
jgi:16S rRNA (adenine1518-N6/adenine1519-N6)-dimethyltransferase